MEPLTWRMDVGGLSLNVTEWGAAGAPLLLLLHGGMDHSRNWDAVAGHFARDWRVVAPDLRGHGDSDWSAEDNYTSTGLVCDLAGLTARLAEQGGAFPVIGHSLGGNLALRLAAGWPERFSRLLVIEGLGFSPDFMARRDAISPMAQVRAWIEKREAVRQRVPRGYPSIDAACARMRQAHGFLSAAQARHLTRHGVRLGADGLYRWKFDPLIRALPPDLSFAAYRQLWASVAVPVQLAYGTASWASNPVTDGRMGYFSDARVEFFEGAGHWLHHEQTEKFVAVAKAFFAGGSHSDGPHR